MSKFTIYHNPRCSKSRQSLELLREKGVEPEIIEYLKTSPSFQEIADLTKKLGISPSELVRKKEKVLSELSIDFNNDEEVLNAMAKHSVLIERPIILKDNERAVLGRPPENILELL